MEDNKTLIFLQKKLYIFFIIGLALIFSDLIYIISFVRSLSADVYLAKLEEIHEMLEYIWASVTVLTGGCLLFDYELRKSRYK